VINPCRRISADLDSFSVDQHPRIFDIRMSNADSDRKSDAVVEDEDEPDEWLVSAGLIARKPC
jgi:hypothetical protein